MTTNTEIKTLAPQVDVGLLAALLADAFTAPETIAPIRLHPDSIGALIDLELVEFERIDGMIVPTALGAALIGDPSEPVITERDALMTLVLTRRGFYTPPEDPAGNNPAETKPCGCPPGECLGDLNDRIEGRAAEFEPYEIRVEGASLPVPSKRTLLARVAGALQDQSYATTLLLEQIDLLEDDA